MSIEKNANSSKKPNVLFLFSDQHKAREDEQLYRDFIASYYALVMEIDYHIGCILEELERSV